MKLFFPTREKARTFARNMVAKDVQAKVIDHDKIEDQSLKSVNGTRYGVEYFNFTQKPTMN